MIRVQVPGRTFTLATEPIEFSFDAPTWSLGKTTAAHIAIGRIGEVYNKDLEDTIYQTCGRRDEQWEMIVGERSNFKKFPTHTQDHGSPHYHGTHWRSLQQGS